MAWDVLSVLQAGFQTVLRLVYPPRCLGCGGMVDSDQGLCGTCWRDTWFIGGLACTGCGVPLPGDAGPEDAVCDDCLVTARPWTRGAAALLYRDIGRKLVLGLKHGDRHDVVRPAARWMARAARPLVQPGMIVAPVPLHWSRLLKRRFNQAALLSAALARELGLAHCPDLLVRCRKTQPLEGMSREARFAMLVDSIRPHPTRAARATGRPVLLVDDVMTSGATLAAATEALRRVDAGPICVTVLARVAKDA